MKKLIAFSVITGLTITTLLSGCGKGPSPVSTTGTQPPTVVDTSSQEGWVLSKTGTLGELPLKSAVGQKTLTVAGVENYDTSRSYNNPLPVWDAIEKQTGVKIVFEVTPSAQYSDSMKTRVAAGSKLPDIIRNPDYGDLTIFLKNQSIIGLNDLITNFAPNTNKLFEIEPMVAKYSKYSDGTIYGFRAIITDTTAAQPYTWAIRTDWLKTVGMAQPKTTEDLYNVLKAFKTKIPNAIPLGLTGGATTICQIGSAWGLHLSGYLSGIYPDSSGKLQFEYIDPRAKLVLQYLNKLYKEGLLNPDFFNPDGDMTEAINKNQVGVMLSYTHNLQTYMNGLKDAGVTDAFYDAMIPVVNNPADKPFITQGGGASAFYVISKDCKDTELAVKWMDYVYASEQGSRYTTWGIEGTSYTIKDGKPQYTDFALKNPEGKSAFMALASLGANPTVAPVVRVTKEPYTGQAKSLNQINPELLRMATMLNPYLVYSTELGQPTADEDTQIQAIEKAGFLTYMDEAYTKFITGDLSFDKWDEFITTVKAFKLDQYMQIQQARYDRFNK